MDLAALKTEITLPAYVGKSDVECADMLNAIGPLVNRESVDGGQLAGAIVRSEFVALTANDRAYVSMLIPAQNIPLTAGFKTEIGGVFGAGTATRANLVALLKRSGSRSEELNLGGPVTSSHVANARRL